MDKTTAITLSALLVIAAGMTAVTINPGADLGPGNTTITSAGTSVTIDKYRCEDVRCAFWISAKRDGKSVAVNNPVWLVKGNTPEDMAVIDILAQYADNQPIGNPIAGTKE